MCAGEIETAQTAIEQLELKNYTATHGKVQFLYRLLFLFSHSHYSDGYKPINPCGLIQRSQQFYLIMFCLAGLMQVLRTIVSNYFCSSSVHVVGIFLLYFTATTNMKCDMEKDFDKEFEEEEVQDVEVRDEDEDGDEDEDEEDNEWKDVLYMVDQSGAHIDEMAKHKNLHTLLDANFEQLRVALLHRAQGVPLTTKEQLLLSEEDKKVAEVENRLLDEKVVEELRAEMARGIAEGKLEEEVDNNDSETEEG